MPTKCELCGIESYVIYIRQDKGFICPECEDKERWKEGGIYYAEKKAMASLRKGNLD
jgi:hypothetical protein